MFKRSIGWKFCVLPVFILCNIISCYAQKNQYFFHQLTTENGLSNNSITCVFKDIRGFVWIGTVDGLNRYDGYTFKVYKHVSSDLNSISDNFISTIVEDYAGNLWIGTQGGGLNKYNPVLERFTNYIHKPNDTNSLSSNFIFHHNSMLMDADKTLWIGTDNGLCSFNIKQGKFKKYNFSYYSQNQNEFSDVRTIFEGKDHILWIGTNNGLIKFHRKKGVLKVYAFHRNRSLSLTNNIITSIAENTQNNELWVGTEDGLNVLYPEKEIIKHYFFDKNNSGSISDNSITSIVKDEGGNFWIGTKSGGLNKFSYSESKFYHWENSPNISNSISDNYIDNLYFDKKGYLWIGTVNNGVNLLDIKSKKFTLIKHDPGNQNSLSYNTIRSVFKDKDGFLWIGTYGGGLNKYDGKNFLHYLHQPDNQNSLGHNIVSSIFEDKDGYMWIGTWGGGLSKLNKRNGEILRINADIPNFIQDVFEDNWQNIWLACNGGIYIYNSAKGIASRIDSETKSHNKLTATSVNKIIKDHKGNLWAATFDGLNEIVLKKQSQPEIDSVIYFKKELNKTNSLSEDRIMCLYEDKKGTLWIGTYTGGLNKIVITSDLHGKLQYTFKCFTEKEGLAGNIIYGILEDNNSRLWISTNNGISKFDIKNESFQNFTIDDGLQSNQFYWNAYYKSNTGEMYFGGTNGLNMFYPDSLDASRDFPKVYITDLLLFNRSVEIRKDESTGQILNKSILFTHEIELARKDYPFTFEFAAILFKSQNKIKYAYQLDNFDHGWLYTDAKKRYATYSHLRPGTYIFKVKSTNEDGTWNNTFTQIKIRVLPAIWETVWAFIFYGLVLITLLYFFRSQILARARYKHEIQIQRMEREKMEEYNDLKLRFFTNVSHEFRTPLTLILGPLEGLLSLKNIDSKIKEQLLLIHSGGKRLLHLINQLLEFRKVETGNFDLRVSKKDVTALLHEIALLFNLKAQSSNIKYSVNIPSKSTDIWFDEHVIETIAYNLLSNAFKFTPSGGRIKFEVEFLSKNEEEIKVNEDLIYYLILKVSDTGIGIPPDKQEDIFKRFYQVNQSGDMSKMGTGIGLTLCKDLASIHYGSISLDSTPNVGSVFRVKLPVHVSAFADKNIVKEDFQNSIDSKSQVYHHFESQKQIDTDSTSSIAFDDPLDKNAPKILIIEDDTELIKFIGKILENSYRIFYALNGVDGLKTALEVEPDLIISDVMMPEMNGFEVCERIKNDIRISHIPVILLTAFSSLDNKIKGLATGADDYISKPFNQQYLLVRIEKLIEQRGLLRKHFQKEFEILPDNPTISNLDEQLLKKVIDFIEKNIAEPELSVDDISAEVGMSSTHLYRKMKSLTDMSTNELIRKVRIRKAAVMLLAQQGNISQVMNDVGFTNSSYFAKRFQEEYGMLPKEYISKNRM